MHRVEALADAPVNPARKQPPNRRTILRTEARNLIDGKLGECSVSRKNFAVLTVYV